MGKPPNVIPSVEKNISIPSDLCARIDLILYSDLQGRVPHGAWSRYITGLIRRDLEGQRNAIK